MLAELDPAWRFLLMIGGAGILGALTYYLTGRDQ